MLVKGVSKIFISFSVIISSNCRSLLKVIKTFCWTKIADIFFLHILKSPFPSNFSISSLSEDILETSSFLISRQTSRNYSRTHNQHSFKVVQPLKRPNPLSKSITLFLPFSTKNHNTFTNYNQDHFSNFIQKVTYTFTQFSPVTISKSHVTFISTNLLFSNCFL